MQNTETNPVTTFNRIETLKRKIFNEYNNKRRQVGLFKVREDELLDPNKKLERYVWEDIREPLDIKDNQNLWSVWAWLSAWFWLWMKPNYTEESKQQPSLWQEWVWIWAYLWTLKNKEEQNLFDNY